MQRERSALKKWRIGRQLGNIDVILPESAQ
jgi:hypothetical protein